MTWLCHKDGEGERFGIDRLPAARVALLRCPILPERSKNIKAGIGGQGGRKTKERYF